MQVYKSYLWLSDRVVSFDMQGFRFDLWTASKIFFENGVKALVRAGHK